MRTPVHLSLACLSLAALVERTATADDGGRFAVSPIVGFGVNNTNAVPGTHQSLNAYGLAVGGRGGYTGRSNVEVGVSYVHHFGYDRSLTDPSYADYLGLPRTAAGVRSRERIDTLLVELGYELHEPWFRLRPYLGLGAVRFSSSNEANLDGDRRIFGSQGAKPAVAPGLVATYRLTEHLAVGVDVRYAFVLTGRSSFGVVPYDGSPNALLLAVTGSVQW